MPTFQRGGVALIGSAIAAGCGLWLGAHVRLGGATPAIEPELVASSVISWAAPAADAAEPEFDVSPTLLVKANGQWVTPEARAEAIADRQAQADVAAQVASEQASIDQAVAVAEQPPQEDPPAAAPVSAERDAPAPVIPPPIQISALTP